MIQSPRPREHLGRELQKLRLAAGLSGLQLAEQLGVTQSRVSRTETGRFRAGLDLVQRWLAVTDAKPKVAKDLMALAGAALTDISGYRQIFRGSLLTAQRERILQDAKAQAIRHFQPFMIPGPLQTAPYARAALLAARVAEESDIDEAVEARMERGDRLRASGVPTYDVILTEAALAWRPVDIEKTEYETALRHVLSIEEPHITVRLIPLAAPTRRAAMCGFMHVRFTDETEPDIVQVELPAAELTFADSTDVAAFLGMWERMEEAALDPRESAARIRQLLRRK